MEHKPEMFITVNWLQMLNRRIKGTHQIILTFERHVGRYRKDKILQGIVKRSKMAQESADVHNKILSQI